MAKQIVSFRRDFQIWRFFVGHGQLLLRSTKTPKSKTRIDVLFKNVGAIHLPAILQNLEISEISETEFDETLQLNAERLMDRKLFLVRTDDFKGYVVAGFVGWHEDEGEYDDLSYFKLMPPS